MENPFNDLGASASIGFWRSLGRLSRRQSNTPAASVKGLGTFIGVYTPTVLTILGVIMYLRMGWVVGHLGLIGTLIVVVLANIITLITTLSFSAVATNSRVGIGGAYFIISRSLGIELGGAIGLPLYLSQVFSVTLYAFGLAESFRIVFPSLPLQPVAFVVVVAVGLLTFKGANMALKTQIPIMGLIALSIVALGIGAYQNLGQNNLQIMQFSGEHSFFVVFAVFFPAVTGIMAGLGLSGDLRDPSRSIPLGSISACLTGFAVYLAVPFLLGIGADAATLRDNSMVWSHIAPLGFVLILPGLWGAIFSSAVGSMLGAPRTLQALALDHLAPQRLGESGAQGKEPIFGLLVSLVIALGAIFLGDLNQVAVVVTMFFLTVYGMINLVAAAETLSGNTAWRPKIRPPWWLSLLGAIACFAVMFLINPIASFVAISVELLLWLILQRKERQAEWGDARRDVYEALIRWSLLRLRQRPMTARNWRPHVLVFVADAVRRLDLVRFGHWFAQGRGVVTICEMKVGDLADKDLDISSRRSLVDGVLEREGLPVFFEVNVVHSVEEGIIDVTQANGLAGLQSNTVLLGWRNQPEELAEFLRAMRRLQRINKSVLIGQPQLSSWLRESRLRQVHIWWGGLERNGDLMLMLAHLLTRNPEWRRAQIKVLSIASNEVVKQETENNLGRLIPEIRINAEVKVIIKPKERSVAEIIAEESAAADITFLGLATPQPGEELAYAQRLLDMAANLQSFFFVKNASLFVGDLLGARPTTVGENLAAQTPKPSEP